MDVVYNFCPACAHPLHDQRRFGRVRRACAQCGFVYFREPKVAVSVLVTDEQHRALLIRRRVDPRQGSWALPSGFIDFDEDPRTAARREVEEETGLIIDVQDILDVAALGDESMQEGIILFFRGEPTGGRLQAGDDASEVRWFAAHEVPMDNLAFSTTQRLLAWLLD